MIMFKVCPLSHLLNQLEKRDWNPGHLKKKSKRHPRPKQAPSSKFDGRIDKEKDKIKLSEYSGSRR
jgi:hypothetical protein